MRAVLTAIALCTISALPALAALPPQWQRKLELTAILDSDAIIETFGVNQPIEKIEYVGQDLYRLTSGPCTMDIKIVDAKTAHEAGFVGAREFAVEAGEMACK